MASVPNLFTIAPHRPFLVQLAQSWLSGALGVGRVDDPLARIDTVFYLPTRRAARAFADVLTGELGGTALLPTIRTLADADDEESFDLDFEDSAHHLNHPDVAQDDQAPRTMSTLRRRLLLTKLIDSASAAKRAQLDRDGGQSSSPDDFLLSRSVRESAYLAKVLGDLLDQVATEEADWRALQKIVPEDHAAYWQLTHRLVSIITDNWPDILRAERVVDPATYRRWVLDRRAAQILSGQIQTPIIAAGSTGSIPATARFLKAVSAYDRGAVVLPGLDQVMPEDAFVRLGENTPEAASHPQHGMRILLERIGARRETVTELAGTPSARQRLLSAALLPASETANWSVIRPVDARGFENVSLIEAKDEFHEALAIAMQLKASVVAGQRVALVTPDRKLAQRVVLEAARFGLQIDDSAGIALRETLPARLIILVAQVWQSGFAAIPLLSLLKHPLTRLGEEASRVRETARLLERLVLRGPALAPGLHAMRSVIEERSSQQSASGDRPPALRKNMTDIEVARVLALIDRLESAFSPLSQTPTTGISDQMEALFATSENLCAQDMRADARDMRADVQDMPAAAPNALYADAAGEALAQLRLELRQAAGANLQVHSNDLAPLFEALTADRMVRPRHARHPDIHLWGPLEARLQSVDHMILGGLNEAVWPTLPAADPLLSRAMMIGMNMTSPERRIGLSAHDVEQAFGHEHVTLTRARKVDGTPTVASRWLQRVLAFLPDATVRDLRHRAKPYADLASEWDTPALVTPRPRPEPRPAHPPTQLAITDVEPLIRDPYTIYARKVLGLEQAPPLGSAPGAAERGLLFHRFFERLAEPLDTRPASTWPSLMQDEARAMLASLSAFPDVQALWEQRIQRVIPALLDAERLWSSGLVARHSERTAKIGLQVSDTACRLTGRIDRVDLYADGTASLLDFKTGHAPSKKQIRTFAPQLTLAAAMLATGGVEGIGHHPTRAVRYVKAGGNRTPFEVIELDDQEELKDLADTAMAQLKALWATFLDGAPFVPLTRAQWARDQGAFHHLARVKEWRAAEESDPGSAQG